MEVDLFMTFLSVDVEQILYRVSFKGIPDKHNHLRGLRIRFSERLKRSIRVVIFMYENFVVPFTNVNPQCIGSRHNAKLSIPEKVTGLESWNVFIVLTILQIVNGFSKYNFSFAVPRAVCYSRGQLASIQQIEADKSNSEFLDPDFIFACYL
jgi:hypothetical protein